MRITSKGQVTIPVEIREAAGFLPHTEVQFEIQGNIVIIRKAPSQKGGRGDRLVEKLRGTATSGLTTDEILELTRGGE